METIFNIPVGREGVGKVTASMETIADGVLLGRAIAGLSLPLSLLDSSARDLFAGKDPGSAEPVVFLPMNVDGEFDENRKIRVQSADCPRDPFDGVPEWFLTGCQKLFPNEEWTEHELRSLNREDFLRFHSAEWIEKHKDLTVEQLREISGAPYCSYVEEMAVMLFSSNKAWLDHWGWVTQPDGRDVLVSEPYGVTGADLRKLIETLDKVGWDLNVRGVSGHYPSATMRIEIAPKGV
jgi:hypothetical protein